MIREEKSNNSVVLYFYAIVFYGVLRMQGPQLQGPRGFLNGTNERLLPGILAQLLLLTKPISLLPLPFLAFVVCILKLRHARLVYSCSSYRWMNVPQTFRSFHPRYRLAALHRPRRKRICRARDWRFLSILHSTGQGAPLTSIDPKVTRGTLSYL